VRSPQRGRPWKWKEPNRPTIWVGCTIVSESQSWLRRQCTTLRGFRFGSIERDGTGSINRRIWTPLTRSLVSPSAGYCMTSSMVGKFFLRFCQDMPQCVLPLARTPSTS